MAVAHKISGWLRSSDRTEKRRRLRRPLLMRVDVEVAGRDGVVPGQIVDVSGSGCRVELQAAPREGRRGAAHALRRRGLDRPLAGGRGALAAPGPRRHAGGRA